jgi:UDP-arabinose 4-epimerase
MSRVLVTGGAGYIGSHCCKALAEAGFEPFVFDNLSTGHRRAVRWGPLIEGDMRDRDALLSAMRQARPDAVIHFAALSLVGESAQHPERYYDVNVVGTLQLLEAMRAASVERLVFSSTAAVYGEPEEVPISETSPEQPVNPYGATKRACERMMADFDAAHGIRSVRLRYFNAAGADPAAEIGEMHDPETHLLPIVIEAALGRRPAVSVFGSDYPTPDGTAVRDYIHVVDLAAAHVAALRHLLGGGASDALNLGTGRGASVSEVIARVEAVTGRAVPVRAASRRVGDPPVLVADPRRAEAVLGWRAELDLDAMVGDAWRWHRGLASQGRPTEAQDAGQGPPIPLPGRERATRAASG